MPIKKVNAVDVYRPDGFFDLHNMYKSVMGAKNLGILFVEAVSVLVLSTNILYLARKSWI